MKQIFPLYEEFINERSNYNESLLKELNRNKKVEIRDVASHKHDATKKLMFKKHEVILDLLPDDDSFDSLVGFKSEDLPDIAKILTKYERGKDFIFMKWNSNTANIRKLVPYEKDK